MGSLSSSLPTYSKQPKGDKWNHSSHYYLDFTEHSEKYFSSLKYTRVGMYVRERKNTTVWNEIQHTHARAGILSPSVRQNISNGDKTTDVNPSQKSKVRGRKFEHRLKCSDMCLHIARHSLENVWKKRSHPILFVLQWIDSSHAHSTAPGRDDAWQGIERIFIDPRREQKRKIVVGKKITPYSFVTIIRCTSRREIASFQMRRENNNTSNRSLIFFFFRSTLKTNQSYLFIKP